MTSNTSRFAEILVSLSNDIQGYTELDLHNLQSEVLRANMMIRECITTAGAITKVIQCYFSPSVSVVSDELKIKMHDLQRTMMKLVTPIESMITGISRSPRKISYLNHEMKILRNLFMEIQIAAMTVGLSYNN